MTLSSSKEEFNMFDVEIFVPFTYNMDFFFVIYFLSFRLITHKQPRIASEQ